MFSKRVVKEDLLETASDPEITERNRQNVAKHNKTETKQARLADADI